MKNALFLFIALIGTGALLEAKDRDREMTPEEARERAQIVTLGGD